VGLIRKKRSRNHSLTVQKSCLCKSHRLGPLQFITGHRDGLGCNIYDPYSNS